MQNLFHKYKDLFSSDGRIGRAINTEPVHIEVDDSIEPVQQKRRPIPLQYIERFEKLLDQLKENGVVSGPLGSEWARGWIHNPVITDKRDGKDIRLTLDTRTMADAVKTSHFPIPTSQELRHNFSGSDRFSKLDMNHSFFQFPMDEETQKLYVFYTTKGLYKFNTLVQGASSASAESHERIRKMLVGLDGVIQIKDDLAVHGKGQEHDIRLEAVLERLNSFGMTSTRQRTVLTIHYRRAT